MNNNSISKKSHKTLRKAILATTSLAFGTLLLHQVAFAANVQNLILSGNISVSSETVFQNLDLKIGQEINQQNINASIASLHSTGLFKDITITYKGSNVYITVEENPTITAVRYIGNQSLDSGLLNSSHELRTGDYFTKGQVQAAVKEIKKKYTGSRFSNVEVSYKIVETGDHKADLIFSITEGAETIVQKVSFVGNSVFSDGELRGVVSSKEAAIWHMFSGADTYSTDKVNFDRELLRRHYLENGYADFSVISAVADYDEDSNKYFITFTLDEGEQYKFGEVDVDSSFSNLLPDELLSLVKGRTGDTYNAVQLNDTLIALRKQAARKGFSFAKVTPIISRNPYDKTIDVVYAIEDGQRVYIDRIQIVGNTRTHDQVIRREIELAEGDVFNAESLDAAKSRLFKTGYFTGINIITERGSADDKVIVIVEVNENSTGSIGATASYSTLAGLIGELTYAETNLLGSGQQISASLKWSGIEKAASFSFTEPRFMGGDYSVGTNLFGSHGVDKDTKTHLKAGVGLVVGLPIDENINVAARYNFTYDNNRTDATTDYISAVGVKAVFDTRNKNFMPTEGFKAEVDVEFAGLGGNVKYIKAVGTSEGHFEIVKDFVASAYVTAGAINGWGGATLRQQDTFFKGGDLVRGFAADGLGPRAGGGDANGGTIFAGATLELTTPLSKEAGIYVGVFADAGTLYKSSVGGSLSDVNEIRSSVGASMIWDSPIGPLRADYAYVLNSNGVDVLEPFKFGLNFRY
ncbi:MAG: outer membrane protein assembly factor BamA [Rhizobiales bacterium]|nr:outer membrane protein assembly factor BamA [Hyphomicrobiales bacterium]NRB12801.1 outer membrane protein assembly factor BamA [Hyphomicrobiales bacterium]